MEGEFTEPSGVVANSGSDIALAGTKNDRIQVFDQNCRLKLQFGEVGRGDGEMFFLGFVALARATGDIIVTRRPPEMSPTRAHSSKLTTCMHIFAVCNGYDDVSVKLRS